MKSLGLGILLLLAGLMISSAFNYYTSVQIDPVLNLSSLEASTFSFDTASLSQVDFFSEELPETVNLSLGSEAGAAQMQRGPLQQVKP